MTLHYDSLETCMAVTFICMLFEVYYTVAYKGELPHHGKAKRWFLKYCPFNGTFFGLCLAIYLEKYYEVRFFFSALIFAVIYLSLLLLMKLFVKYKRKIS